MVNNQKKKKNNLLLETWTALKEKITDKLYRLRELERTEERFVKEVIEFSGSSVESLSLEEAVGYFGHWRRQTTPLSPADEKFRKELVFNSEIFKRIGKSGSDIDRDWAIATKDKLVKFTPSNLILADYLKSVLELAELVFYFRGWSWNDSGQEGDSGPTIEEVD